MNKKHLFKYCYEDSGYCRIVYSVTVNESRAYFCFQEDGGSVEFYNCNYDAEMGLVEPSSTIDFFRLAQSGNASFELPRGNSKLAQQVTTEIKCHRIQV